MAIILIEPIIIEVQDDREVEIYGIDPCDSDCICGRYNETKCRWNESGICRDNSSKLNISPHDPDVMDLLDTIKKITIRSADNGGI